MTGQHTHTQSHPELRQQLKDETFVDDDDEHCQKYDVRDKGSDGSQRPVTPSDESLSTELEMKTELLVGDKQRK